LNSNKEKQQKLEIKTMTPTQSQTQEEQAEKFINQNDESLKNKDESTTFKKTVQYSSSSSPSYFFILHILVLNRILVLILDYF
jgi:hypothetical protein